MYIDKAMDLLEKATLKRCPVSLMFWGATGIGKTSIVDQVGERVNYQVINIRLSQREAVDILGVPYIGEMEIDGKTFSVSNHHPPKWFMEALMRGNVILFLDELNRAHRDVLQAAFELVLERRINGIQLPDSVQIISACNPPNKNYDTFTFDDALVARFCHIQVLPSVESWKQWAVKDNKKTGRVNIDRRVYNFIANNEECLNDIDEADKQFPLTDHQLRPHSRSWEFVSHLEYLDLDESSLRECVRGIVGSNIAQRYMMSRNYLETPISVKEILSMDLKSLDDVANRKFQFFLGNVDENGDAVDDKKEVKIRIDSLKRTCEEIKTKEKEIRNVPASVEKILDWVEILPPALGYAFLAEIFDQEDDTQGVWSDAISKRETMVAKFEEMANAQIDTKVTKI